MSTDEHTAAPQLPATVATRDGLTLALTHWPAPCPATTKGVICLVHGLGEHAGRYQHVARHLNQCGWSVVGYDHRGHGRSPGPRGGLRRDDDLLHDLAAVIDLIRQHHAGQRLGVLGHSMGGITVARFVSALAQPHEDVVWRREVDLCMLSSPALDIGLSGLQRALLNSIGRFTPDVAVGNGLDPNWVSNDPAVVKAYLADPLVHDRITGRLTRFMLESGETVLARAPTWTVPTLLLYAGADHCVRPQGSVRFAAAAPAAVVQVQAYEHMAHEIFNEPDRARVLADLQAWLARQ